MTAIKERPILFSAPMVRAILEGRKTVTRRAVKFPLIDRDFGCELAGNEIGQSEAQRLCPYGQAGQRLWAREACRYPASLDHYSPSAIGEKALDAGYTKPWCPTHFEADGSRNDGWQGFETPPAVSVPGKLRPPMFMPRWASRILLEITDVRVERVQDITEEQAKAEGIKPSKHVEDWFAYDDSATAFASAAIAFGALWNSVGGDWDANPWVWVVEFKRVTP